MASDEFQSTDEILASMNTDYIATLTPAPPEYGAYRYFADVVATQKKIKAMSSYRGPPVTLGQTLVFDMARPDFWDKMSVAEQFRMKKNYLKANYVQKLLWFEEDGVFAKTWARVFIYKYDYFARFEVVNHLYEAVQFDTSMILLNHLCRHEMTIPDDYDTAVCATLKITLESQLKLYLNHIKGFEELRAVAAPANRGKVAIPRLPAKPAPPAAVVAPAPCVSPAPHSTSGAPRTPTPPSVVLPIRNAAVAVAATYGGGGRKPPKKFVQVQHRDTLTSAATIATTNYYNDMTLSGRRRRICDRYGGMDYDEALKSGLVLQFEWKLDEW